MDNVKYQPALRYIHFGLIIFGITGFLSGELAEDEAVIGYWVHATLGILLLFVIVTRIIVGFSASEQLNLKKWWKTITVYKKTVKEDIKTLMELNLPHRKLHEGIAGLVQLTGLLGFSWMCITGVLILVVDINRLDTIKELVYEVHEIGESVVLAFLFLHIGAVIAHYFKGENLLKRINPF